MDCIFCKIVRGEIPCHRIYEDEDVLAFLDISMDAEGHTLVVPKRHCKNILDCDDQTLARVTAAAKKISQHYAGLGYDGVNLLNNSGSTAHQSVMHLHFHIIPRRKGDGLKVFPKLRKNPHDLEATASRLKLI